MKGHDPVTGPLTSVTIAINVTDLAAASRWYTELLGGPPDLHPVDDVAEWRLLPTAWLQLRVEDPVGGAGPQTLHLGVEDLAATVARLRSADFAVGDPVTLPDLASFCDLRDLDGNRITLYQLIAPRE